MTMPVVQMGLAWFNQQPYLAQFHAMRAQNKLLDDALNVLSDGFSREVFFYVDARGPEFINTLGQIYNSLFWNGFLAGLSNEGSRLIEYSEQENTRRALREVLDAKQYLRVPGLVFGLRLSDPQAGHAVDC